MYVCTLLQCVVCVLDCVAWDYLHTHKICHLKNGIPDLEEGTHHGEVYTGFGCTAGEFPRVNDAVVT